MRRKSTLAAILVVLVSAALVSWSYDGAPHRSHRYEVRTSVRNPEVRSDAARAIDAYERLMERTLDLTHANLMSAQSELQTISHRLARLEVTVAELKASLGRIERAVGSAPPKADPATTPPSTP